jgi:phage/plasmid-associated DNA primase
MDRDERIGMNEAVFRDVNERIQDVASTFNLTSEPLDLICECGDAACVERITLSRAEYEQIRADPQLFAVANGHVALDVEEVAATRPAYEIVRKYKGVPAEIAEQTDPRSEN